MKHQHDKHDGSRDGAGRWVFWGFPLIAGFFLVMEHRAHVFPYLPFVLVLACPLMHLFHRHGGHAGHQSADEAGTNDSDRRKAGGEKKKHAGGCH